MERDIFEVSKDGTLGELEALIITGVNVNAYNKEGWTPLALACASQGYTFIGTLINAGAKINLRIKEVKATPLMLAVSFHNIAALSLLVQLGAKLNLMDSERMTALAYAEEDNFEFASMMLKRNGAKRFLFLEKLQWGWDQFINFFRRRK